MLLKWCGSGDEVKGNGVLELRQDAIFGHSREIAQQRAEAMDRAALVGELGAGFTLSSGRALR